MSFQTQQTYLYFWRKQKSTKTLCLVCTNKPMNGTGRHKTSEEHKQIKTTSGEIHQNRWHYGNRWCESAESQWFKNKGEDMRYVSLATFRRHWGDTEVRNTIRENYSNVSLEDQKSNKLDLKTNWKRHTSYNVYVVMTSKVFGSDADRQREGIWEAVW